MVNVIAEIGINHKGSVKKAKELIKIAKKNNCWGVKFQFRDINNFYNNLNEIGDEILIDEIKRTNLTVNELSQIINFSRKSGIKIGVSFFRLADIKKLYKIINNFDFFKVPSAEALNTELIDELLKYKKLVMVSTGGHKLIDLKKSLSRYKKKNLVIFHCVSNYPAKLGSQNLNFLNSLKKIGFKNLGYSSHDSDYEVCLLAINLGIKWIERHLTLNKLGGGLDDSSSSEDADFEKLNKFIEKYSDIFGHENRIPNQGEKLNMQNLGTGIYITKNLKKNYIIKKDDFEIRAPRIGLSVGTYLSKFKKRKIIIDIKKGDALKEENYVKKKNIKNKKELFDFAIKNNVGVPVRVYDFILISNLFPIENYEFHLSFKEVFSKKIDQITNLINKKDKFSIHMPDYLPNNRILDPISENKIIRNQSRQLIFKITELANKIEQKISKKVPIIGSFSKKNRASKITSLDYLFEYLNSSKISKFNILPQWLPVYAWYFGGSVKIELFNSSEDIEYLRKNRINICMDICHLALSANYYKIDWIKWYDKLKNNSSHFHLSDAEGVDGEGLQIGNGEIKDFSKIFKKKGMKILEVWQGHHNNGYGFLEALSKLNNQIKKK